MQRRAFLGSMAGAGGVALAGCTAPGGPRRLEAPTETRSADEVVLGFGPEGDPVARSTLRYTDTPITGEILPLQYYMSHREGTTIESLRLSIRAPPAGYQVPATVYLAVPQNGEIPDLEVYADDQTRTPIVEIADLGLMGEGTFGIELYVDPTVDTDPLPVRIQLASRVTESGLLGRSYDLEATTRLEMARGRTDGS